MRVAAFAFVLLGSCIAASLSVDVDTFESEELKEHVRRSVEEAEEWYEQEQKADMLMGLQSSKKRHTKTTPESEKLDHGHNVYQKALEIMTTRHNVSEKTAARHLRQTTNTVCGNTQLDTCTNSKYRTFDGSCNNINNPRWGQAGMPQNRVAQAAYDDGAGNIPRGGKPDVNQVGRLPNERAVSQTLHFDRIVNFNSPPYTNMVPQFGQFLDHDLSITPEANSQCCAGQRDTNCWPIGVQNDQFYRSLRETCMDFTRSTPCSNGGQREQLNMNTAYIDGSQIYGSGRQTAQGLRAFTGGRLITNNEGGLNGFIPGSRQLNRQSQGRFVVGDGRVNEMPGLAVMHNLFLMEHNRLADLIRQNNPSLNDETIYQEARRLVGAQLQQVVYNEYLPAILGSRTMGDYGLALPANPAQYTNYNSNSDATIFNAFSTAAYRFGHTLVSGLVRLLNNFGQEIGNYQIKDQYFQDFQMTQSNGQGYDWIMRGLTTTPCQQFDPFVTTGMTNFLFKAQNANFGSDLVARNIRRGRDHGLPGYNAYRNLCGLEPIRFVRGGQTGPLPSGISQENWNKLVSSGLYANGDDVDLFTGGLLETTVPGGASGPTFNCLKATQFARLKAGDRFFFTHAGQRGSFTPQQLIELRRVTLGDIICKNSQQSETPRNVFLVPHIRDNPLISCNDASRNSMTNMRIFTPI